MSRLIFNDDGGGSRRPAHLVRTPREFLAQRAAGLIGSGVDTVTFCTTAGTFGRFYHKTAVGETADDVRGRYFNSVIPHLLEAGTDPLAEMVSFCRGHGLQVWWSLRMNDTHDAGNDLLVPRLKEEHPEWLLGALGEAQQYGKPTAVDYGVEEVRRRAVSYVQEVLDNYDVDGVELDFFRHPVYFRSTALGRPPADEDLAAMTEVVRQVRAAVESTARRRAAPRILTAIVPDDFDYCRAVALDLEAWLEAGLIDAVTTTGYFRLHPWEHCAAWQDRFGVPVFAGLQEARGKDESGKALRSSLPAFRGRILAALSAGLAGVSLYNAFDTHSPIYREGHDMATLAAAARYHFPSVRGRGAPAGRPLPWRDYMTIASLDPNHPEPLARGKELEIPITVPSPPAENERAEVRLRLGNGAVPRLAVNGHALELRSWKGPWLYALCGGALRDGLNRVSLQGQGSGKAQVEDLLIAVV